MTSGLPLARPFQRPNDHAFVATASPDVGGVGEHRPAGLVEIAGDDVQQIDRPGGEGAEACGVSADASINRSARARRQSSPAISRTVACGRPR